MLGVANRKGGRTSERAFLSSLAGALLGDVISGFRVRQNSPTLNLNVLIGGEYAPVTYDVNARHIDTSDNAIIRDGLTSYMVFTDDGAGVTAAVPAAHASLPRKDYVVLYIDKAQARVKSPVDNVNGVVKVKVVSGTPASTPAYPSNSAIQSSILAGNPYIILAGILLPATATTVTNSMITDLRMFATPRIPDDSIDGASVEDGTILTSKILNPYKFNAYRVAEQSPNSNVIQYDTISFDTNGDFDITTNKGRYTVPVDGYYQFNVMSSQRVTTSPQDPVIILRKNGSANIGYSHKVNMYNGQSAESVNLSVLVKLNEGDYVEVLGGPLTLDITHPGYNSFSGFLVSET